MSSVLITGAGGFIGSHLAELCVERGFSVRAFVRYNSKNDWGWLESSIHKKNIHVITGDIRDLDSVASAMKGREIVFHLAALIGIPYSYISPLAYIRTNIEGTYNVLQSALQSGVRDVLVTSTSETYGTAQYVPIDENHTLAAQSPYAATKISSDQLALSYYRSFGLPVKVVRPFNAYGPRQSARAIIPTIITQLMSEQKRLVLGNLQPTRDLTYVQDTACAFLDIHENDQLVGQVTNVGTNQEISVKNLATTIAGLMNREIELVTDAHRVRPQASEVERLLCDNRKILSLTKWRPVVDLKSGLTRTIEWIASHLDEYKAEIYNV